MLQLKRRNVTAAAHSLSVLAKRDERELGFLLNFIDAKQQKHLAQVQSVFNATWAFSGERNGKQSCKAAGIFPALS